MKSFASVGVALGLMFFAIPQLSAGQVTVKKVHVCCGACVTAVKKTLGEVEGVTNGTADQKTATVTFNAADDAAAKRGIDALAKAGFHGTATHGDKAVAFPKSNAKKGDKANTVTFTNVHLCCPACVKGADAALKNVKNIKMIDINQKTGTVTLSGEGIEVIDAVSALNDGGFHGNLKTDKAE
jgi:periplasmic mercuric ion binding protein